MMTETFVANGSVYKGYCVSLSRTIENRVELTDWNDYESIAACVGIAIHDAAEGLPIEICVYGIIEHSSWNFELKKPIYAFASGTLTQNIPPKHVLKVGFPVSNKKMFVKISDFLMISL